MTAKLSRMMQGKANIYKFRPKFTKKICKIVQKQAPFSAIKQLVLLKKTVNIDVSTYESVQ